MSKFITYKGIGDSIEITMDSLHKIHSIKIDDSYLNKESKSLLEEVLLSTINSAIDEANEKLEKPSSDVANELKNILKTKIVEKIENGVPTVYVHEDLANEERLKTITNFLKKQDSPIDED